MSSRFFPIGGNGNGSDHETYKVQPGDIKPLFACGALMFATESDGAKYIRITEKGMSLIERINK
jgi:predicted transcriptional regulator